MKKKNLRPAIIVDLLAIAVCLILLFWTVEEKETTQAVASSAEETSVEESTSEEASSEEASVEEASSEEASVEEASSEVEASTEETVEINEKIRDVEFVTPVEDGVDLYLEPVDDEASLADEKLSLGDHFKFLGFEKDADGKELGWAKIDFDGAERYVKSMLLDVFEEPASSEEASTEEATSEEATVEESPVIDYVVSHATDLNVRAEASTAAESYELVDNGAKFNYVEEDGDWTKVEYADADNGYAYIYSSYLDFFEADGTQVK